MLLLKENVPAESFGFFFDILLVTVRNEIASCLEKVGSNIAFFTIHDFIREAVQKKQDIS